MRFKFKSAYQLFWPMYLLAAFPFAGAATQLPDLLTGKDWPYPLNTFIFLCCPGVLLLGWAAKWNWQRMKWIETADRGGIRWWAGGRVRHRPWKELVHIDTESYHHVGEFGDKVLIDQALTVKFEDGTQCLVKSWQIVDGYMDLRHILLAKEEHAKAEGRAFHTDADWSEAEQEAAGQVTKFGPLTFHGRGLEWDGIYYSWEQIEGYDIQQGMLIIRTVDGDEFLRRTADLGDWRSALARIQSRLKNLSARKGKVPR